MGINSMPRDGRNACLQLGFCFQGCKSGAKWSAGYSEIPKAEQTGNFELRTQAHVIQITHNKSGKIDGVVYVDADGNQQKQKARIVAVAGNSIETPRLLLMSNSSMYPDGLSNSSGQVGKNYELKVNFSKEELLVDEALDFDISIYGLVNYNRF